MLRMLRNHTKGIMIVVILFFVLSCFAGYGLYVRGGRRGGDGTRDYPVAEASGRKILRSELERSASRIAEQARREITSEDAPIIRKSALDAIVLQDELEKEIEHRKIEATADEIDEAYKRAMDSYPTREEFMATMQRTGLTESQIKDDIKSQLQMKKLVEALEKDITIDDKEVKEFYDATKDFLFKRPDGVKVNVATFRSKAAAEAAHKAIEGGAKWDEELAKYSKDIEMVTSYDHPALMSDTMLDRPEFASLKDYPMNKLTPVSDAGSGFSFIAIKRSREAEHVLTYDEASADAKAMIKEEKLRDAQRKFYDQLLSRAEVKILDESIFPAAPVSADAAAPAPASADAAAPAPAASGDKPEETKAE